MLSSGPLYFRELARTNHILASAALVALAACSSAANHSDVPPVASQTASVSRVSLGDTTKALLYVIDSGTNEVFNVRMAEAEEPNGHVARILGTARRLLRRKRQCVRFKYRG